MVMMKVETVVDMYFQLILSHTVDLKDVLLNSFVVVVCTFTYDVVHKNVTSLSSDLNMFSGCNQRLTHSMLITLTVHVYAVCLVKASFDYVWQLTVEYRH